MNMRKILVVEDHERHRRLLTRRLSRKGYDVLEAEDGRRAIDVARHEIPDLILMDIDLPVCDGHQATREIKALDETQHIPIIALSAYDVVEERRNSFAAGCDEFEPKPLRFEKLLEKIESLCGQ